MNKQLLKTSFAWSFILWLIGFALGIMLFPFVPTNLLGWVITPLGTLITLWVLFKRIHLKSLKDYVFLAVIWTSLAIILDYFFLVKAFNPADGYYKFDVYLYYALTFTLPIIVGKLKTSS